MALPIIISIFIYHLHDEKKSTDDGNERIDLKCVGRRHSVIGRQATKQKTQPKSISYAASIEIYDEKNNSYLKSVAHSVSNN
jgi:hypothetical protein